MFRSVMMRMIKVVLGLAALVLVALGAASVLLPDVRTSDTSLLIRAEASAIRRAIEDVQSQPQWRKDVREVVVASGTWTEVNTTGQRLVFTWTEQSDTTLAASLRGDMGVAGDWRLTLTPTAQGTDVRLTERLVLREPLGRLLSWIFFDLDAFAQDYLSALRNRVETAHGPNQS
jgi:hypothetical protein